MPTYICKVSFKNIYINICEKNYLLFLKTIHIMGFFPQDNCETIGCSSLLPGYFGECKICMTVVCKVYLSARI